MSEMIERVKAAMLATETDVTAWDDAALTELARAAIEAMREPTTEMGNAAVSDYNDHNAFDIGDAVDAWQAMIDEALK